jgi:hypothetical protein
MFSTLPRTLYPLVTRIESLASSCFLKIAAFFAKLQRLRASDLPPMHHLAPSPGSSRKRKLPQVSPNQIEHAADDKDDDRESDPLSSGAFWNATLIVTARSAATSLLIGRRVFSSPAKPSRCLVAPKLQPRCFTTR